MDIQDIRAQTADQLAAKLIELRTEQHNLRFRAAQGALEKSHRVREIRTTIARIKTILTARVNGAEAKGK
jgi:large subunit ribosomal protein L29